jgi:hypothetical protein
MFKNQRKGVELTMNVVIIAVISLLVLMLLAVLLIKTFGNANTTTQCTTQNGECIGLKESCSEKFPDKPIIAIYSCPKDQKCCTGIGITE